jgi:hypothetical protein
MARSDLSASACKAPKQNSPTPVRGPIKGVASKATRRRTSSGGKASLTAPGSHSSRSVVPGDDQLGGALGNHQYRDEGICSRNIGHYRRVDHTEPFHAYHSPVGLCHR